MSNKNPMRLSWGSDNPNQDEESLRSRLYANPATLIALEPLLTGIRKAIDEETGYYYPSSGDGDYNDRDRDDVPPVQLPHPLLKTPKENWRSAVNTAHARASAYLYEARVMMLVQRFFPDMLPQIDLRKTSWHKIFRAFLDRVEQAGWLPIDWSLLDWLWDSMNLGEDIEDTDYTLAQYLTGIPVRYFAPNVEDLENSVVLGALYCLLSNGEAVADSELFALGLPPAVNSPAYKAALQQAIRGPFPPDTPEPFAWLPAVADILLRRTGNFLLDEDNDYEEIAPLRFRWDSQADLVLLNNAWVYGRMHALHYDAFTEFFYQIDMSPQYNNHLDRLGQFIRCICPPEAFSVPLLTAGDEVTDIDWEVGE